MTFVYVSIFWIMWEIILSSHSCYLFFFSLSLSLPHPCLGMSADGSPIVLIHMATLWGPVTRQLQVLLRLPWQRFFNDVVAAPMCLSSLWMEGPFKKSGHLPRVPSSTPHPKHTHSLVTQPRNLLSFQRVTGTNNPTMPAERTGVDIHTGSLLCWRLREEGRGTQCC